MDVYPEVPATVKMLDNINLALTAIFIVEMVWKLIGLGVKLYVKDRFNCFDAIIVIISVFELIMDAFEVEGAGGAISALRTFRLMRVFKLARSWTGLQQLLKTILKTIKDIGNFALLLVLHKYRNNEVITPQQDLHLSDIRTNIQVWGLSETNNLGGWLTYVKQTTMQVHQFRQFLLRLLHDLPVHHGRRVDGHHVSADGRLLARVRVGLLRAAHHDRLLVLDELGVRRDLGKVFRSPRRTAGT